MSDIVSLNISKEVVTPIVEQHIKNAVVEAFGGRDQIISKVLDEILNKKVNREGKVSSYSSDNTYRYIDVLLTQKIEEAVRTELEVQITKAASKIKDTLILKIKSDKGASVIADALLDGLQGTLANKWASKITVEINPKKNEH